MNRQGAIKVWQNTISTWGKRILISALNCSAICISSMDGFNSTDGTGKLNNLRWSNCGMIWWRNVSRLSPLLQPKFKYCKFGQSIGRSCQWNELATGMPKWEHWRLRWVSNGLCISKRRDHSPKQLSIKYNSLSAGRKSVAGIADKWRSLDSDDLKEEPQIDNVSSLVQCKKWLQSRSPASTCWLRRLNDFNWGPMVFKIATLWIRGTPSQFTSSTCVNQVNN